MLTSLFVCLGLPIVIEKLEVPACELTFLGIEIDTWDIQLRLPRTKLQALRVLVKSWLGHISCSKKELQSLAGKLQHTCKVVKLGHCFLQRMFELMGELVRLTIQLD